MHFSSKFRVSCFFNRLVIGDLSLALCNSRIVSTIEPSWLRLWADTSDWHKIRILLFMSVLLQAAVRFNKSPFLGKDGVCRVVGLRCSGLVYWSRLSLSSRHLEHINLARHNTSLNTMVHSWLKSLLSSSHTQDFQSQLASSHHGSISLRRTHYRDHTWNPATTSQHGFYLATTPYSTFNQ